jgi:hypothetical protein
VRSQRHPVPELDRDGDWFEVPFWIWQTGVGKRGRVLVRPIPDGFQVRSAENFFPQVLTIHENHGWLSEGSQLWEKQGLKIRPRALMTTLFVRLLVGDFFIHGIGGGKYDELTDQIIRNFFNLEPPAYAVLSATRFLPFSQPILSWEEIQHWKRLCRDLWFNPQRHLELANQDFHRAKELAQKKSALLSRQSFHWTRKENAQVGEINQELRQWVGYQTISAKQHLDQARAQWLDQQIFARRDFPFLFYPEEKVRPFLQNFL